MFRFIVSRSSTVIRVEQSKVSRKSRYNNTIHVTNETFDSKYCLQNENKKSKVQAHTHFIFSSRVQNAENQMNEGEERDVVLTTF